MSARPDLHHASSADIRAGRAPSLAAILNQPALLLSLIMLTALLLRLYRIGHVAVWVDETYDFGPLHAPDLATYLSIFRFYAPDNVPFYLIIFYYWSHLVGVEHTSLIRLLSVLVTVAYMPFIYLIGRRLYSHKAGIIAAALAAISPMHLVQCRLTRQWEIIQLLALISMWALLRAMNGDGRRWWVVNAATSVLIMWLHMFGLIFLATEGIFLLLFSRRHIRRLFAWSAVHAVIVASPLLYLQPTFSSISVSRDDFYVNIPPLNRLLADLFADDAVMSSDPFFSPGVTWPFLPERAQEALVSVHGQVDAAMVVFFLACVAVFSYQLIQAFRNKRPDSPEQFKGGVLLLLVALLPVLLFVLLSIAWRPCLQPRYSSYSSLSLYLIVGCVVAGARDAYLRRTAVAALLALYAYQLSVTLPSPETTDWYSAKRLLAAEASPTDLIAVKGTFISLDTFRYNMGPCEQAVVPVYTEQSLCEKAPLWLKQHPHIWAIVEPYVLTIPPLRELEKGLTARGLKYRRTFLPGMNGLYLYCIEPDPAGRPVPSPEEIKPTFDPAVVLADLGLANDASARAALIRVHDYELPCTPFYYTLLGMHLAYEGNLELAEKAADRAIEIDKSYAWAVWTKATILGEKGDAAGASNLFTALVQSDRTGFYALIAPVFNALYVEKDLGKGRDAMARLQSLGVFFPHVMRARAGLLER